MNDYYEWCNGDIQATLGCFEVGRWKGGRHFLFEKKKCIAECLDFHKTHGTIEKWLAHIHKQNDKRLSKIEDTIRLLEEEHRTRSTTNALITLSLEGKI